MARIDVNKEKMAEEEIQEDSQEKESKDIHFEEEGSQKERDEKEVPLSEMSKPELLEKIEQEKDISAGNYELYIRSQAEMDNMKKRFQKEKEDFIKFSNESLIKQLLTVMDNLEKAVDHSQEGNSVDALREGVDLTLKGLMSILEKEGLEQIKALHEPFDPNFHEAVSEQEDESVEPGTVIEELQKGYLLRQRLIRPAMVVVSKKGNKVVK